VTELPADPHVRAEFCRSQAEAAASLAKAAHNEIVRASCLNLAMEWLRLADELRLRRIWRLKRRW
jgi:hypothetical protein